MIKKLSTKCIKNEYTRCRIPKCCINYKAKTGYRPVEMHVRPKRDVEEQDTNDEQVRAVVYCVVYEGRAQLAPHRELAGLCVRLHQGQHHPAPQGILYVKWSKLRGPKHFARQTLFCIYIYIYMISLYIYMRNVRMRTFIRIS